MTKKTKRIIILINFILLFFIVILYTINLFDNNFIKNNKIEVIENNIKFHSEGNLFFYKNNKIDKISTINIEFSKTESEIMQGLMWRKKMKENNGMIFIFQKEKELSFWMKNTIIHLDIIFINSEKKIVKIHKNTRPYSEENYNSLMPAKYVVEVVAGYTENHNIKEGDYIDFKRKHK